jgi:phosphoglycolate phosphatase
MKYKAVLFDLDGTLLDTLVDLAGTVNRSLAKVGFPAHKVEEYKYFVGDGREQMAERALPPEHRDAATLKKLLTYINEDYTQHWGDNTATYEGIPELLDELVRRKTLIAVLSNKPYDFTETMVDKLLSKWRFAVVAGAMPSVPIKPDPTSAIKIARDLNIAPSDFLYLGDTDIDMKTAVGAKMFPCGVLWGFRTAEELKAGGARALVQYPGEVLKLL